MTSEQIIKLFTNPVFYTPILAISGAILGSWFTYVFGLRKFHREIQYQNKLKRYLVLVERMRGFVAGMGDDDQASKDRTEFVNSYRTVWLYGDACVVKEINQFLKIVLNPPAKSNAIKQAKEQASSSLKKAIIAMRKDLKANGKLKEEDFDIFI